MRNRNSHSSEAHEPFAAPTTVRLYSCFEDVLSEAPPLGTHRLKHDIVQLCGGATAFVMLAAGGDVLTFGSGLHSAVLGRPCDVSTPARQPSIIPFLGGIRIKKIACGGWIGAALSYDRDLYVWGGRPGEARMIESLADPSEEGPVQLVDIDDDEDILDVGVGAGHLIALTAKGEVWTVGDSEYGQLGRKGKSFCRSWSKASFVEEKQKKVVQVGCGPWNSWILRSTSQPGSQAGC